MLVLKHAADRSAQSAPAAQVPVDETLAAHLERALLVDEERLSVDELRAAASASSGFTNWLLRAAELRLGRTVNRTEQAVEWLARNLLSELVTSLVQDEAAANATAAEWRLCALVKKIHACQQS